MPAAALPALLAAAAAPLVPLLLLLMCHPLQPRPKKRPCWHATQRFAFLTLLYTTSSSTTAVLHILLILL